MDELPIVSTQMVSGVPGYDTTVNTSNLVSATELVGDHALAGSGTHAVAIDEPRARKSGSGRPKGAKDK